MDISQLQQALGPHGVLTAPADLMPYETGARYGKGKTSAVLRPASTDEVAFVVRYCAEHGISIVIQGGNTGLVAASTPDASGRQLLLSLDRLSKNIEVDPINRSVTVDAGVTLADLNHALEKHNLMFPIDLSANPTIGGMISANTGGSKLLRYGDVRRNLLGMEAVLIEPAGMVVNMMQGLRKNNAGIAFQHLFVGSSGAFGVVTRAILQAVPLTRQSVSALLVPSSEDAITDLLVDLENEFGDVLTAFEGMSRNAMTAALKHVPRLRNPFGNDAMPPYVILVELASTLSPARLDLEAQLTGYLEERFGATIENAVLAKDNSLWDIRHAVSEGLRGLGNIIAFDVSVPRSAMVRFRAEALALLEKRFPYLTAYDFGHWGDGGCHFNVVWPRDAAVRFDPETVEDLRVAMYELVVDEFNGSFSAEHGVGPYNQSYYQRFIPEKNRLIAGRLQRLFDPHRRLGNTFFGSETALSSPRCP